MSGFDLGWLDLREPADRAARDKGLLERAAAFAGSGEGWIVDLGCGSGSTLRALDPLVARRTVWRLLDHNPALLRAASARAGPDPRLEWEAADLAAGASFEGARLVTASALLDLVSEAWVADLAIALARAEAGLYAALSYDGIMAWPEAPHALDAEVTEAFNAHQRTDKGFGPALGPAATRTAVRRLEAQGFTVETALSPWRLGAENEALERALVVGIAEAAVGAGDLNNWLATRLAAAGRSGCVIGHLDLLALPPS